MRTSLRIEDDSYAIAVQYAKSKGIPLSRAVSELIRRGAGERVATKVVNGVTMFDLPPSSPRVTTELVRELEVEES